MESCTNDKHKGHKTVNVYIQNKSIIHHSLKQKPLCVFAANKHNEQNKPWQKKKKKKNIE